MSNTILSKRGVNLLGAFALVGSDALRHACEEAVSYGGETAAALVILGYEPGLESIGLSRILGLSQVLGLSHAGTVRLVDKLVAQGLVLRERDPDDQRAVRLNLSQAGLVARATILASRRQLFETMMQSLSQPEQAQLEVLLDKMIANWSYRIKPSLRICRLCETEACNNCPVERASIQHSHPAH